MFSQQACKSTLCILLKLFPVSVTVPDTVAELCPKFNIVNHINLVIKAALLSLLENQQCGTFIWKPYPQNGLGSYMPEKNDPRTN